MSSNKIKVNTSKPSYVYSVISIVAVLFVLGVLGIFLIHAHELSRHFKENVEVTLVLKDVVNQEKVSTLQNTLKQKPYVKSTEFISKEAAAKEFMEQYEEDFTEVLNYNPLFSSLSVYLQADYANEDSLTWIKEELKQQTLVDDIFYQATLLDLINTNTNKITLILLAVTVFFLLIAITLLNNTIKLTMYTNRFLIKSMQLVGATQKFIIQPFLKQSIYKGAISGAIACILLAIFQLLLQSRLPELALLNHFGKFVFVCLILFGIGILISWWSTRRAIKKYMHTNLEDLY